MPISLEDLKKSVKPSRTVILFGAGASIPSGAPSGVSLAHKMWGALVGTEPQSDDLVDTASILERRYGRKALVEEIRRSMEALRPSGGLLSIPHFEWSALFSTNFDLLLERAYQFAGKALTPIRSNFDLSMRETQIGTTLYKIHGCITQDRSLGDKASMTLTEQDYEDHLRYRQSMFATLNAMMHTNDVIVIGQSLRGRHLQDVIKQVLAARHDGASTTVYILVYDRDDLRAPLLEDRGAKIVFGGIDEFTHAIASELVEFSNLDQNSDDAIRLPPSILSTVHNVSLRVDGAPNVLRMFNGAPASFPDIRAGATFARSRFADVQEKLLSPSTPVVSIIGAAGVGKTTFARQIAMEMVSRNFEVWEHKNDFPFHSRPWISV